MTSAQTARWLDLAAFFAGAIAAGVGVALGEVAAALVPGAPSLVLAVGDLVIAEQPPGAKEVMVALFGEADKLALNLIVVFVAVVLAGVLGILGRRDVRLAIVGFLLAGTVGLVAALAQPSTVPALAVATLAVSVGTAVVCLRWLLAMLPSGIPGGLGGRPDWRRRSFLQRSAGLAVGSLALGVLGRNLLEARPGGAPALGVLGRNLLEARPGGAPAEVDLPEAAGPAPGVPAGASLDVAGITPIVVPNDRFYRIDTALFAPRVDVATWRLRITGMVDREVTLTYEELSAMPLFEQYVTIACVSNEVGGDLVGNALWTGVDLRDVLDIAGVQPGATQTVGRSVDGWTAGFPTAWAMAPDRRPMIALGMNRSPLPVDHGYPARLIIPGLYGYVSATKWLAEIELTTLEAFDAYWVPLGWAKEAPILTQSRIDVPRDGESHAAGRLPVAGVAWAPDRGISAVEVRVDDGPWQKARLSRPLSEAAWVQWVLDWDAPPGEHRITVRATDGHGEVQTEERTRPEPDGARGHHSVSVRVA